MIINYKIFNKKQKKYLYFQGFKPFEKKELIATNEAIKNNTSFTNNLKILKKR